MNVLRKFHGESHASVSSILCAQLVFWYEDDTEGISCRVHMSALSSEARMFLMNLMAI